MLTTIELIFKLWLSRILWITVFKLCILSFTHLFLKSFLQSILFRQFRLLILVILRVFLFQLLPLQLLILKVKLIVDGSLLQLDATLSILNLLAFGIGWLCILIYFYFVDGFHVFASLECMWTALTMLMDTPMHHVGVMACHIYVWQEVGVLALEMWNHTELVIAKHRRILFSMRYFVSVF